MSRASVDVPAIDPGESEQVTVSLGAVSYSVSTDSASVSVEDDALVVTGPPSALEVASPMLPTDGEVGEADLLLHLSITGASGAVQLVVTDADDEVTIIPVELDEGVAREVAVRADELPTTIKQIRVVPFGARLEDPAARRPVPGAASARPSGAGHRRKGRRAWPPQTSRAKGAPLSSLRALLRRAVPGRARIRLPAARPAVPVPP